MTDTRPINLQSLHPAVRSYLSAHWAMEPTAHARLMDRLLSVGPSDLKAFWDDEEDDPRTVPAKPTKKPYQIASGVAVLPLVGVLQKREDWFTRWFPGEACALEPWVKTLQQAAADPDVSAIVMAVDSPGGLVDGTAQAGDAVYQVRQAGKKPILAVTSGLCCSAAYWIASQASELWAGETDWLGSIGTRLQLVDSSGFYELLGLKIDYVTSGEFKAAGADGLPVTDAVRAYFQTLVDRSQVEFNAAVARGRKLPIDDVRAVAKEARLYVGSDAKAAGLIDGIDTLQGVVSRLQKSGKTAGAGARTGQRGQSMGLRSELNKLLARFGGADEEEEIQAAVIVQQPAPLAYNGRTFGTLEELAAAIREEETEKARRFTVAAEAKAFADGLAGKLTPAQATSAEKAYAALALHGTAEDLQAFKSNFEGLPSQDRTKEHVGAFVLGQQAQGGDKELYDRIRAEGRERNGTAAAGKGK